jgi:hypothetical protein
MRMRLRVAAIVVLISASAAAGPPEEARKLYEDGSKEDDVGEYDKAIDAFERAYALSNAPGLLFNIAQAYRLKGPSSCEDALRYYEMYRAKAPRAPNRAETDERIGQMRECASEVHATPSPEPPLAPRPIAPPRPAGSASASARRASPSARPLARSASASKEISTASAQSVRTPMRCDPISTRTTGSARSRSSASWLAQWGSRRGSCFF